MTGRVVIVQDSLRRYREGFYAALRADLADSGVDVRLLHATPAPEHDERGDAVDIPWARRVTRRQIPVSQRSLVWHSCLRHVAGSDLVIVEQASQLLLNYVLVAAQRAGRPRLAFWGHGRNFSPDASGAGERVKRWMSRQAHWWFAYTDQTASIVAELGFPADRITVVRNATDTADLARRVRATGDAEVTAALAGLGLTGGNLGLFVGALRPDKRFDFLVAAADRVRAAVPGFELVVAGDGPERGRVLAATRERPWLRFAGHRAGDELAPLLRAARLLLIPGWVGLVVVDGFAAGVPLVTSASGAHPPEVAYLQDGVNGVVVDDGGDPARYAAEVIGLLADEPRRRRLVQGCLRDRERFGAEDMAARFAGGIRQALVRGRTAPPGRPAPASAGRPPA